MISTFSFTFNWNNQQCQCILNKFHGKLISLYFNDPEIISLVGEQIDLYKRDGRLVLPCTIAEENLPAALVILDSIEEVLRKPLLWMFK